jgi:uncharacterized membrane protein
MATAPDAQTGVPIWVLATWFAGLLFLGWVVAVAVTETRRQTRAEGAHAGGRKRTPVAGDGYRSRGPSGRHSNRAA